MVFEKGIAGQVVFHNFNTLRQAKKNLRIFFAVGALKCGKQEFSFLHFFQVSKRRPEANKNNSFKEEIRFK
jgi:hypothetical protein